MPTRAPLGLPCREPAPRVLLIDNYDSYTHNLLQLWPQEADLANLVLIRNDQYDWTVVRDTILPHVDAIVISPGPGTPHHRSDLGVVGELLDMYRRTSGKPQSDLVDCPELPSVLGVCLGHQAIATAFGGRVVPSSVVLHGQVSLVTPVNETVVCDTPNQGHDQPVSGINANKVSPGDQPLSLFNGIATPIPVVRYHSLVVDPTSLPREIIPTAWTTDTLPSGQPVSVIMALRHAWLPLYGVQFHPESVCTSSGKAMLQNFFQIVTHRRRRWGGEMLCKDNDIPQHVRALSLWQFSSPRSLLPPAPCDDLFTLHVRRLPILYKDHFDEPSLARHLLGNESVAFWLDSSSRRNQPDGRFSYLGVGTTPGACTIRYQLDAHTVSIYKYGLNTMASTEVNSSSSENPPSAMREVWKRTLGVNPTVNAKESAAEMALNDHQPGATFWNWLDAFRGLTQCTQFRWDQTEQLADLPLGFRCGLVGIMGYEMKDEAFQLLEHRPSVPQNSPQRPSGSPGTSQVPDATFLFADRCVALDHATRQVYLLCLVQNHISSTPTVPSHQAALLGDVNTLVNTLNLGATAAEATAWFNDTHEKIQTWLSSKESQSVPNSSLPLSVAAPPMVQRVWTTSRTNYTETIRQAQRYIREGESYELCLTTPWVAQLRQPISSLEQALSFYLRLRRHNPAPYATFLYWEDIHLLIASSSPERFMSVTPSCPASQQCLSKAANSPTVSHPPLWVEMKPIKGTIRRPPPPTCSGRCMTMTHPDGRSTTTEPNPFSDRCPCYQRYMILDQQRATDLKNDAKERAENLMIVDLIRHDLITQCLPSSVRIPRLMAIETYQTVHQMVTTVQGQLRPQVNAIQVLAASFPPGSMTGAPKRRSVALLAKLETRQLEPLDPTVLLLDSKKQRSDSTPTNRAFNPLATSSKKATLLPLPTSVQGQRNLYSGCLGYLSVHGAMDMSVVIRTAVVSNGATVTLGAGGAITVLSDPLAEYDEVLAKVDAVWPAIADLCI
ncbi:para-aminobenzoate synthase, (PABA) [Dispira parvispora]|uniref:aminodeoxychorismate synthase n=1 Tax=Dispira parvispora TaxID=1520584 RepID=A0A9W8ATC8_9FUNG|nr:para-aminobenzoate synthase, (PABA) [Dispira parvispora]